MNRLALLVGVSALALAGCNSSSSTGPGSDGPSVPGPGDGSEISDSGEARGVSNTASEDSDGDIVIGGAKAATADYEIGDNGVTLTFTGGDLDGESITFDENGDAVSGLDGDEEGFLTAIGDADSGHSIAAFVEVTDDDGSTFNALHTGAEVTDMPDSGTVTYSGDMAGVGANPDEDVAGDATGSVAITADFDNGSVEGTISGIHLDEDGTTASLADVGFEAEMDTDSATYTGDDVTIGGAGADGLVDGGFYGPEAVETAGGITAANSNGALIGAFRADKD